VLKSFNKFFVFHIVWASGDSTILKMRPDNRFIKPYNLTSVDLYIIVLLMRPSALL